MPTPDFFGHPSRDALNAQYDIEATIPDFGAFVDRIVGASADTRATVRHLPDIRFGPTVSETYDVFLPANARLDAPGGASASAPALFFVHGGYWKATTSKEWSYVAKGLTDNGFVVAVENYALRPAVTVAEIVRQHRAAFAHFWAHAGDYGVDTGRIVVAGHSAGGHAVAMLMDTPWESDYGLPARPIKAAIPISGLFDLRPLAPTVFGPILALSEREEAALSPQLHVRTSDIPHVVVYGQRETQEFELQSSRYADALRAAGTPVDVLRLKHDHFTILDELADADGAIASVVIALA